MKYVFVFWILIVNHLVKFIRIEIIIRLCSGAIRMNIKITTNAEKSDNFNDT